MAAELNTVSRTWWNYNNNHSRYVLIILFTNIPHPELCLVDPPVPVLVQHGEGDLEPRLRLDQDGQQEEVLAVRDDALVAQAPEEVLAVLVQPRQPVHHGLDLLLRQPLPLEPGPGLALHHRLEEVLRRHVDLPVVLDRGELDEALLAGGQLAFLLLVLLGTAEG